MRMRMGWIAVVLSLAYKDFGYSAGLVGLGRIDAGIEALSVLGSLQVTIERVGK